MKVMKLGGGCLKDGDCFVRAAEIIKAAGNPCAVVVSAANGITDILIESIREAENAGETSFKTLESIRAKHQAMIQDAIPAGGIRDEINRTMNERLKRLEKLLLAVSFAGEVSPSLRANIVSYGERLAALVLSGTLRASGTPSEAWDSDEIGMITEEAYENATVNLEEFRKNVEPLARRIFRAQGVPVITGFFGRTPEGKVSTFGRNGSDYSAAVVASALDASSLEIWKDVDGFMSADPDKVASAVPIRRLSRLEAAELSYFGAKILHPRTFEPFSGRDIAVVIRNFLEPDSPGTEILARGIETDNVVKSVTSNGKIALLRIHGPGVGFKPGVIGKLGRRLADAGVNIYSVITSQTCINLIVDKADAARGHEEIRTMTNGIVQRIEIKDDIALIAVVGEGLLRKLGIAARIFSSVSRAGINVEMISTGASEVAAYFIVGRNHAAEAVAAIHEDFFGGPVRTADRRGIQPGRRKRDGLDV